MGRRRVYILEAFSTSFGRPAIKPFYNAAANLLDDPLSFAAIANVAHPQSANAKQL
jgi:hypothetical protein